MSKKSLQNKVTNTITIIKHPIFDVHHKNLNESIKTSNYQKTANDNYKRPVILKYIKNNAISKAIQKKNSFNQTLKSTFLEENLILNKFKKAPNLTSLTFDNYKNDKENQASIQFNNSLLNQKYHNIKEGQLNFTKVRNQYLKLSGVYNPHKNYSEIVNDRKHIIRVFLSQTKNNFNNNYYLIYSNPDKHKRNYISKCFETIKNNSKKNIDRENSIKALVEKEIYNKRTGKIFNVTKKFNKRNNICIEIPSSFNINHFLPKSSKFKIQTLNAADNILKEYADPFKIKKKKRIAQSALFKKFEEKSHNFFKTREDINNTDDKL